MQGDGGGAQGQSDTVRAIQLFLSQKAQNSFFSFDKPVPGAGSAPGAGGSTGGGEGSWLTALIPRGPLPPAPGSQMLRRQQVINLDILHFFISSYLTFNEILTLNKGTIEADS